MHLVDEWFESLRNQLTSHVVTAGYLVNVDSALWARLRSQCLDRRHRLLVIGCLVLVAAGLRVPGSITVHAESVLTVRASDLLLAARLLATVFNGEVVAARRVQAGDVLIAST